MRLYVDTSAIVSAYLGDESDGDGLHSLLFEGNHELATSALTLVEFASAFYRAARAGRIRSADPYIDRADFDCSSDGALALIPLDLVVLGREVRRLLGMHALGAADAFHVATAIVVRSDGIETGFVTRDKRQAEAARVEGFELV
jgi:predicted nucleic acid-binding protein